MKILELRFQNLNSLYGEWAIDFSAPEYLSDGIFALTGPTGAGKSTILDAICLALYGSTPRLGKITKSGNEIVSRQTGECYAEVLFESQAGKFRCHWSQHRARRKPGGKLADSKHEIADACTGQILESKKRDVANVIEQKTGMDFDRFTRSILLAQGGFDTFLKADVEQKSRILEQITGSEIYTEISKRVHERQRVEHENLDLLLAETSGIAILTAEQEADVRQELAGLTKTEAEKTNRMQEIENGIQWLTCIQTLRRELSALAAAEVHLNTALEAFRPERVRLEHAQKAAQLDGPYAQLSSARKQRDENQAALKNENAKLPEANSSVIQKEALLKEAELVTIQAREEQKSLLTLIQQVRTLDQQLTDKKKLMDAGEDECRKINSQVERDTILLGETKQKLEIAQNDLQLVQEYLKVNARDESLVGGLAGIEEKLQHLSSVQQDLTEKNEAQSVDQKQLSSAAKTLAARRGELTSLKQELTNVLQQINLENTGLNHLLGDRLLREYRIEKETLLREMALFKKIADLESERIKLEDGQPCPLCGSEIHPYAEGNVPEVDETETKINTLDELINKAEQLESNIQKMEISAKGLQAKVTSAEKLVTEAENDQQNLEKSLIHIANDLTRIEKRFADLKDSIRGNLEPLGIQELPDFDLNALLESLKNRLKTWQDWQQKKGDSEKEISKLQSELNTLTVIFETHNKTLGEKQKTLGDLREDYEKHNSERHNLFGIKNPDKEEQRIANTLSAAEQAEKTLRTAREEAQELLHSITVRAASLQEQIANGTSELQTMENDFVQTLNTAGFIDEQTFIAQSLLPEERERLTDKAQELNNQKTSLQTQKQDRQNRLTKELEKRITDAEIDELEPARIVLRESLNQVRNDIAALTHNLSANDKAKETIREKQSLIDAQKKECNRWEKLHRLIGSADGKKFRNFAQGLTFEMMVSQANKQLESMSDRYLLIRDDQQPLELNVIDHYQAGEIRSVKNLSGGESFIISLSLALGLSNMASRKVKVDSLFLDEGFGTLDEESLETALDTLASLHQDGKLIGIISHVQVIKERISTQINITSLNNGKSTMTGPGCSAMH